MALKIEWGNEDKTYIYSKFTRNWMWDDFYANYDEYVDMVKSVSHRVDFVGDFNDAPILPSNFFSNTSRTFAARLPNEGYLIVVNASMIVRSLYNALSRVLPMIEGYVIFVSTLDDALDIVHRDRNDEVLRS